MEKNLASESMGHVDVEQMIIVRKDITGPATDLISNRFLRRFVDFPHLLTYNSATTFHIENHAVVFDGSIRSFCIESSSLNQNAIVHMRPCEENESWQMWFMDVFGQLRPKDNDLLCLLWENKELSLSPNCKSDFYTDFLHHKIYKFNFEQKINAIYVEKLTGRNYIGVNSIEPFAKMKLYGPLSTNKTLNRWNLKWVIYESQEPSSEPSLTPTLSQEPSPYPTTSPSSSPSAMPSPSPTAKPSPSPSLSQMPSDEPSLLPSDEPSLQPSTFPSDEPSLLPSNEVCCSFYWVNLSHLLTAHIR